MNPYDRDAWDALERERQRLLASRARRVLPEGVRRKVQGSRELVVDRAKNVPGALQVQEAVEGTLAGANEAASILAQVSVSERRTLGAYRSAGHVMGSLAQIRQLELEEVDSIRPALTPAYVALAGASGIGAGFVVAGGEVAAVIGGISGGAAGATAGGVGAAPGAGAGAAPGAGTVLAAIAADATFMTLAAMRLTFQTATFYGFDVRRPEERLRALGALSLGTATTQAAKNGAYVDLKRVAGMIVRNASWRELDANAMTIIVRRVYAMLAERLTKAKLGSALPILGVAIGGTFNVRTMSQVALASDLIYRELFLREKYGLHPAGHSAAHDYPAHDEVIDIPVAEIVEEAISAGRVRTSGIAAHAEFRLQFDPSELESLADRFSYRDDSQAAAAGASAAARGHYSIEDFLTVCNWKTDRSKGLVQSNDEATVRAQTASAIKTADERERMAELLRLKGVGVPTASALLHFAFPDEYPILDERALESLGLPSRSSYSIAFWLRYVEACRALSLANGVSIRTLDKALWQASKEAAQQAD